MADSVSPEKKRKYESVSRTSPSESDKIFERFYEDYKYYDDFVNAFSQLIRDLNHALLPSVITSCDAHTPNRYGRSFSNSECEAVADTGNPFHFGTFFLRGIDVYKDILQKKVPEEDLLKDVASSLLSFLLEEGKFSQII